MKTKKRYSLLFALTVLSVGVGALNAQNRQSVGLNVQQVSSTMWNTPDGVPYVQVPGFNLGAVSFEVMGENKIAFLSSASNEIIVTDKSTGKSISRFPVSVAPRDFIYEKGFFYVLDENQVAVYSEKGKRINSFILPATALGVERLTRFGNETYLLLPSGNSLKIESASHLITPREYEGWITSAGHFVLTKINGDNSYAINVITAKGKRIEKVFSCDKKIAGVYVVGASTNRVYLDVQTFVSENPISVERKIVAVQLGVSGLGKKVASINVPDCYYVFSNKDFYVPTAGNIFNMATSPQGAFVFSLTESKSGIAKGYPSSLTDIKYHFNDHLLQIDSK